MFFSWLLGSFPTITRAATLDSVKTSGTSSKQLCLEFKRCKEAKCLIGFADADWATDTEDHSVSGFLFQVYGNTVSWSSKKQTTVATTLSDAENVALSSAASEAIWLIGLVDRRSRIAYYRTSYNL